MSKEKKERRLKRIKQKELMEKSMDAIRGIISLMKERDPEFKNASEKIRTLSTHFPNSEDAPEEQRTEMVSSMKTIAEKIAPIFQEV